MKKPIISPNSYTRNMQMVVYSFLDQKIMPSPLSFFKQPHGWERLTNLKNNNSYIYVDLESTYDKITYTRVVGLLKGVNMPFPLVYAQYCCFQGSLMRGGIASNHILELILRRLDRRLAGIADKYEYKYRRYSDDLFFFSYCNGINFVEPAYSIVSIIDEEGFTVNVNKSEYRWRCDDGSHHTSDFP